MPQEVKNKKSVRRTRASGGVILARMIIVVLLIVSMLFIAIRLFGGLSFSGIADRVAAFFREIGNDESYPYDVLSSSVKSIKLEDRQLFILSDTAVTVLDSSSDELSVIQHLYASPAIKTGDGKAIVYDRNGTGFRIQSAYETLHEDSADGNILTAAIGKKGNVAIASRTEGATSELTVYNRRYEKIFAWKCAYEHISDVALSDNGKYAAVCVSGAKNGEIYSVLYIFNFDIAEPVAKFDYPSSTLIDVSFTGRKSLCILADNVHSVITDFKTRTDDVTFLSSELNRYSVSENGMNVLALSMFGSTASTRLVAHDKDGEQLFELTLPDYISSVSCTGKYVCVLADGKVITYNNKGEEIGSACVDADCSAIYADDNYVYTSSLDELNRFFTLGDNKNKEAETTLPAQTVETEK
ncbi:MAG: hypothetical protein GX051_01330 [Clostridiales bacterium]|nr:hypothetical protein [Clostridiales bacterium]